MRTGDDKNGRNAQGRSDELRGEAQALRNVQGTYESTQYVVKNERDRRIERIVRMRCRWFYFVFIMKRVRDYKTIFFFCFSSGDVGKIVVVANTGYDAHAVRILRFIKYTTAAQSADHTRHINNTDVVLDIIFSLFFFSSFFSVRKYYSRQISPAPIQRAYTVFSER